MKINQAQVIDMLARLRHHTWSSVLGINSNATKPHFRYVEMCITHHVFRLWKWTLKLKIMQVKTLPLKLISPIPPPRDAYYNAHKEYELGSMEVLKEVPFGRVVMGLLVFLKVGIILVLWCLQWGLNFLVSHQTSPNSSSFNFTHPKDFDFPFSTHTFH